MLVQGVVVLKVS